MLHLVRGFLKQWPGDIFKVALDTQSSNPNLDAYGKLRVSEAFSLFDCQTQYDKQPFLMDDILAGGGTTTFLSNESSVQLNVGTVSGDKVTRRSRQWIRYQPSRSQQITMTGVLGSPKTNVSQRIGYFENNNGLFFEQTSTGIAVVRRTFVSGSIVNNSVPQASWNLDTLDGSGNAGNPSGKKLDTTKALIYTIDLQWLGVSRVRWGINFGDVFVYVHQFSASNVLNTVYMTTGNLPVTYELENTGVSASTTTMKAICCAVNSEGGTDHGGFIFAQSGALIASLGARVPVISIRPKLTFNGIVNRGQVIPLKFNALNLSSTAGSFWELVYNGALTGAAFASQSANSITEVDTSSSAILGGEIIGSGFAAVNSTEYNIIELKYPLTLNAAGTVGDTLTLVASPIGGNPKVDGALIWKELR